MRYEGREINEISGVGMNSGQKSRSGVSPGIHRLRQTRRRRLVGFLGPTRRQCNNARIFFSCAFYLKTDLGLLFTYCNTKKLIVKKWNEFTTNVMQIKLKEKNKVGTNTFFWHLNALFQMVWIESIEKNARKQKFLKIFFIFFLYFNY